MIEPEIKYYVRIIYTDKDGDRTLMSEIEIQEHEVSLVKTGVIERYKFDQADYESTDGDYTQEIVGVKTTINEVLLHSDNGR